VKKIILSSIVIFLSFLVIPKTLFANDTIIIEKGNNKYLLGKRLGYFKDKEGELTVYDVLQRNNEFMKSESKTLNFGFTSSTYWVHFKVKNETKKDLTLFLEQSYSLIDELLLYMLENNKLIATKEGGDSLPFNIRDVKHRNIIFKIDIKSGQTVSFYLRYKTESSMEIALTLWTQG